MNPTKIVDLGNTTTKMNNRINLENLSKLIQSFNHFKESWHFSEAKEKEKEIVEVIRQMIEVIPKNIENPVISFSHSDADKIMFSIIYHHELNGSYDGKTKHLVTITPKFGGFKINISGKDKNHLTLLKETFYKIFE